ncbi:MAG: YggT family protein [Polyangiaceae bacterium]|nr:YggT family protein [Polyangiaceae bacterium]
MLNALAHLLISVLGIVELLVLGRVIASWLDADPMNFIVRVLRETTEPLFRLVRPFARKIPGPLDWSAAIILLLSEFLRRVIASALG